MLRSSIRTSDKLTWQGTDFKEFKECPVKRSSNAVFFAHDISMHFGGVRAGRESVSRGMYLEAPGASCRRGCFKVLLVTASACSRQLAISRFSNPSNSLANFPYCVSICRTIANYRLKWRL